MTQAVLVNIDVDDLALAEAFYTRAFGLRATRRFGFDGVELAGAAVPLYLLRKPAGSLACDVPAPARGAVRDYARHWTPVHLDFVVDDLDAALARAESAGARREGEVRTAGWGRIATLVDPFGHGLCVLQFLGRGYDEITTPAA
ncbi:MAG: VOC family protein [Lysobacteraceae bacterium]|nr:MAG: VOC family protein [Xanthomonadaceae bacterium]